LIDVKELKRHLVAAGFEVFRTRGDEVHLAERQNVQLMDSGIRVRGGATPNVTVVMRAQRNDASSLNADAMFEAVRLRAHALRDAGYAEVASAAREIRSVSDPEHLLDVWFEVTWQVAVSTHDEAVAEARRAIATERYVVP
jgi:hypothetical protein